MKFKIVLSKFVYWVAELKIFLGNGMGYFMDFRYPILLAIALKVYFPSWNWFLMGILTILIIIILMILGWFDLRYVKLSQKIAELNTSKYNPYFRRLKKRFK